MSGLKRKMIEKEDNNLAGSSALVAISGGYLDVKVDGNTICTVSVPMPNLMVYRYRDSISQWNEEFHDDDGNVYTAIVRSSMDGVEWEVDIESDANGLQLSDEVIDDISSKITIELHCTENG